MAQDPEGKYEALTKYARDLTAAARDGKLDPVIGRDDEIRRCIQILSRRTKNNPVLIGEPGVGKTAVAEGAPRCALRRRSLSCPFCLTGRICAGMQDLCGLACQLELSTVKERVLCSFVCSHAFLNGWFDLVRLGWQKICHPL